MVQRSTAFDKFNKLLGHIKALLNHFTMRLEIIMDRLSFLQLALLVSNSKPPTQRLVKQYFCLLLRLLASTQQSIRPQASRRQNGQTQNKYKSLDSKLKKSSGIEIFSRLFFVIHFESIATKEQLARACK